MRVSDSPRAPRTVGAAAAAMEAAAVRLGARLDGRAPSLLRAWASLGVEDPLVAADLLSAGPEVILQEAGCTDKEVTDTVVLDAVGRFGEEVARLAVLERHRRGAVREPELEDALVAIKKARVGMLKDLAAAGVAAFSGVVPPPLPGAMPRPRRLRRGGPHAGEGAMAGLDEEARDKWAKRFFDCILMAEVPVREFIEGGPEGSSRLAAVIGRSRPGTVRI